MDNYTPRLKEMYVNTIVPKLKNDLSIKNDLALPRLVKVSLNMGLGEAVNDSKVIQLASDQLASIAGQQPLVTKARKSIATFKIRTGKTIPAIPGKVNVAPSNDMIPVIRTRFDVRATFAARPNN